MIGSEACIQAVYAKLEALTITGSVTFAGHYDYAEPRPAKDGLPSFSMSLESEKEGELPLGYTGNLPDHGWVLHTIAVAINVDRQNQEPREADVQERAIADAIRTAIHADPKLGGAVWRIFFPYHQMGPAVKDDDGLYFQSMALFQVVDFL